LKRAGRALLADSSSIVAAAIIGSSPTTAYIESAAGVASGARTGFSTLVVAALFALALFFSPLLAVVTANVTAPALIIVGVLMVSSLGEIKWTKLEIAVPAFLTLVCMPLTYSIANGIALGLVAYPITMAVAGRRHELHPMTYGLCVLCMLYFAYLA
jgi:AGZA family xanthine/uracil permease-like MFS transporter